MTLYDTIGNNYAVYRRPDPRIATAIGAALGDAQSVVNIGAGTGSYEPRERTLLAVEPSQKMIDQRAADAAPCVQGVAEALPLEAASFDAALAILTVHHWKDLARGIHEMRRVARKRIVLLTWIPDTARFWLTDDYFPEIAAYDRKIFPAADALVEMLSRFVGPARLTPVPIPHDCSDGFLCAYWRRPEFYLDPGRRAAISSFARIDASSGEAHLRDDLATGRWRDRNGHLMTLESLELGYFIAVADVGSGTPG